MYINQIDNDRKYDKIQFGNKPTNTDRKIATHKGAKNHEDINKRGHTTYEEIEKI
jgi:hypothetical protein